MTNNAKRKILMYTLMNRKHQNNIEQGIYGIMCILLFLLFILIISSNSKLETIK